MARPAPSDVYLLADHLDAILATGEDLTRCVVPTQSGGARKASDIAREREDERIAVETIRGLEAAVVARCLKSRERAEELGRRDPRFATITKLYVAGTAVMIEAVSEFGDPTHNDFENGNGILAYLRGRALIAADAIALSDSQTIAVDEDMLVTRRIRLGDLLDLSAMFLNTIEIYYDLYESDGEGGDGGPDIETA